MNNDEPVTRVPHDGGNKIIVASSILAAALLIFSFAQLYIAETTGRAGGGASGGGQTDSAAAGAQSSAALAEEVTPANGVVIPITWGDLGQQMVKAGVIDEAKFTALYAGQGGLSDDMKALLDSSNNGQITMTPQNSGIILNMLWALGLGNKNPILENGPMEDPQNGGAKNFASTAGWTLAAGDAMVHYGAHQFVTLTSAEQSLVESVAKNIYRPCCGNSVYFPDCNHGMAMLGLLELMASEGATEDQMYKTALAVNSYWFPSNYLTIAQYLQSKGIDWKTVNAKDILGTDYSSAGGYQQIVAAMAAASNVDNNANSNGSGGSSSQSSGGGGCGV
jgi:hypothetical protein